MYQSQLVDETGMGKGSVSRLLRDLPDGGLVKKERYGASNIITVVKG